MLLRQAVYWALLVTTLSTAALPAFAQNVMRDDFEGPETSLRPAGGDAGHKLEVHDRVQRGAHAGRWCEHLRVAGNNGTSVYFSHPIGPARVIGELASRVWLKADRGGLQFMAHVVLPRSLDPNTGKPLTTLIRGSEYKQVGVWQQLAIDDLPLAVERQVRVLRTQFGSSVDGREAYVDAVLFNIYGGPGVTNVWIDDLEATGVVLAESSTPGSDSQVSNAGTAQDGPLLAAPPAMGTWPGGKVPRVELKSSLLLVGGMPFFPRVIEHRGEPLARLKALGFNAVWLAQTPMPDILREAGSLGLWLVAPPPPARALQGRAVDVPGVKIGEQFDPVLVWDLGSGLATRELESTRQWAKLVRGADPLRRPLICDADSDVRDYTRGVDLFLARREPLGTTLPLKSFGDWLRQRSQLARGGTPLWAAIQTELPQTLLEQMGLVSGVRAPPLNLQESQIRMLIHAALASRSRGLCFTSRTRLDAADTATVRRAAVLELLNLELELIDRWTAAGNHVPSATTNDPHVGGAVIETDRSRLLLPIYAPPNSQMAMGNSITRKLSFLVPGVPEGNNAYELSPTTFRPLTSRRVTGGTKVGLGEADDKSLVNEGDSLVVFTEDPRVIATVRNRLAKIHQRAAQLTRDMVAAELAQSEDVERRLTEIGRAIPGTGTQKLRETAVKDLALCDASLKTDLPAAYYQARRAQQALRIIARAHWDRAVPETDWPLADPFTAHVVTLPQHYRFIHEMTSATRSPNRLPEGNFEDLAAVLRAGWKHFEHHGENESPAATTDAPTQPAIKTGVDWSPKAAHSGHYGLRLWAAPEDPKTKLNGVIETPPLWVTTAPVHVEQGDLVQIQGWLHVGQPIACSVDGLVVIDSMSGEALALRVGVTEKWRQFTLYRAAARSGPMSVTFALSGLGEAWIDDVSIQVVERNRATQPQQAQNTRLPPARP